MPVLSDAQIAGLAKGVGLSGESLVKAVAIALAESGGNTTILGPPTPYGRAVGVWQIMPLRGRPSTSALKDPNVNAQQMAKISSGGTNWKPWEAYTNGRYLRFVSRARKASGAPDSAGVVQAGFGDSVNPFPEIIAFFEFISDPKMWLRFGMLVGGAILIAIALVQVSGISKTALNVLPQGKVLKAAKAVL